MTANYQSTNMHGSPAEIFNVTERKLTGASYSQPMSRRLSIVRRPSIVAPQKSILYESEYLPQSKVPPNGVDSLQFDVTDFVWVNDVIDDHDNTVRTRTPISNNDLERLKLSNISKRAIFVSEPILIGFIIFPILVLFWEAGWNLTLIMLNTLNSFNSTLHILGTSDENDNYSYRSLLISYFISQLVILLFYLLQDQIYNYVKHKHKHWLCRYILLKLHIFILSTTYIVQWEMMWTIWDQYTPPEWYFELLLSFTAFFALIVLNGHLCDLVCSPFLISYDSIEYCIHIGCPLLTRKVKNQLLLVTYTKSSILDF
ncbi:unnamed protein product [Didymodactylos carnosus]|uniref:Uncharacterized protein n=1 Tax=Didymodactylos carnosus TaxID=1234261 RepID=A0A8S2FUK3_9BILA|nr:unnamed protein product [Didymodactylos carnosus]CAF4345571.1 unnamed protein product [Didymodactylos carnosus]